MKSNESNESNEYNRRTNRTNRMNRIIFVLIFIRRQFCDQQEWKMSSTDPRVYNTTANAVDDTMYIDAIAIAGCVMAGLIALVILRLFVNLCIDVVILGDFHSARRSVSVITRWICPWWHRRTQPEELIVTEDKKSNWTIQQGCEGIP
jgi:hypothetical protein